jgi:hypothetical protein
VKAPIPLEHGSQSLWGDLQGLTGDLHMSGEQRPICGHNSRQTDYSLIADGGDVDIFPSLGSPPNEATPLSIK